MTSRRQFLQIGLAASTLPMAGSLLAHETSSAMPAPQAAPVIPLHKVVFDARFAPGRDFGAEAARRGMHIHAMARGDITDFWFHELDLLWQKEPVAIAGFTQHGPLFVIERFAWDRGLRVAFRAEHYTGNPGLIEHRLTGLRLTEAQATSLSVAGNAWSRTMAAVVTQCVAGCKEPAEQTVVTRTDKHVPEDESFYSWVIAPRA